MGVCLCSLTLTPSTSPYTHSQVDEYIAAMERIKLKEGLRLVMSISADGNKFLQV